MAHPRTIMLRGRRDTAARIPAESEPRLRGFGLTGEVKCKRCGSLRYAYTQCRPCKVEKGRRVGRVDRVEAVTPTERKERATL